MKWVSICRRLKTSVLVSIHRTERRIMTTQSSDQTDMGKVKIRKARPEDREAVLKIATVFEGRDYLPAYCDHFCKSPDIEAPVLLYDDKIICYGLAQLIDNGESFASRAGRTNPEYESRGLMKILGQHLHSWAASRGAIRNVFAISDGYPFRDNAYFRKTTTYLFTKQYPWYWIAGQGVVFTDADIKQASQLPTISESNLSNYFKSKTLCDYIAPEGRMLVDVVPYKMIEANIPLMMQPRQCMEAYSDIKQTGDVCSGLLSFGLVYPIAKPQYKYMLDIFGADYKSLRLHIVKHLVRLKEKTTGVTAMLVYVSEDFPLDKLDGIFADFGISRHPHTSIDMIDKTLKSRQIHAYEGIPLANSKL